MRTISKEREERRSKGKRRVKSGMDAKGSEAKG
jgi:hypothetical protein